MLVVEYISNTVCVCVGGGLIRKHLGAQMVAFFLQKVDLSIPMKYAPYFMISMQIGGI